ncbi:peptidase U32 family protein [Derxia gummosa]|uniref:Peptidase U32 family protein n=1 Tax=Derxia gummosa DSM 723 TaxID=1121388 RepID=A0A8B6X3F3_9BURK|nr:U32 family peptidase [Derxia gummosa]
MPQPRPALELLSPARDADIAIEAVNHGADAVYIGGPAFGARSTADNSVADIARAAAHAHRYGARVFTTLNTILHDSELEPARKLVHELYDAGVDALIVQDMGLLELDLPPIQIHASTQCDIRTVEKAKFLGDAGFSQIVLARELTLDEVRACAEATDAVIEFFVHGALCVAFSGQCYISHAQTGRSANRGDCSQACRLPYTLTDANGAVVAYDKHLLSMKDNDQSANLAALVDAGVRSFKIEGRYKDMAYVKNITAHYRLLLDEILEQRPELHRESSGSCTYTFRPEPEKTFNRGTTDYFVNGRQGDIGAFDAPGHVGLPLGTVVKLGPTWFDIETTEPLRNGDGLSWIDRKRDVAGVRADKVEKLAAPSDDRQFWRVHTNQPTPELKDLKLGLAISRNRDTGFEAALAKKSAERRIGLWARLSDSADGLALTLTDEDGHEATATLAVEKQPPQDAARAEQALRDGLGKLGATIFEAHDIALATARPWFVPASAVNALRRDAIEKLEAARLAAYARPPRKAPVEPPVPYPETSLSYLANVYNEKARAFYARHGVSLIDAAYEAHEEAGEVSLMITKHCLRFSFNLCPKQAKGVTGVQGQVKAEPMTLMNGDEKLTLRFDCKPCEMHVVGRMKKHIFKAPPPSTVEIAEVKFHPRRPKVQA